MYHDGIVLRNIRNVLSHFCLISFFCCSIQANDIPLIPSESDLEMLPNPISLEETDVVTLKHYYQEVAAAYQRKGEKLKERYLALQLKLQKQEEDLMLSQGRAARSYVSWTKSIKQQGTLKSMQYNRKASSRLQTEYITCSEKAAFYQDLADHYGLLSSPTSCTD